MPQLRGEKNEDALRRIFALLEQLAIDPDERIRDMVAIEFGEYMLGWAVDTTPLWPYIGEQTRKLYEDIRIAHNRYRERHSL